MLGFYNDSKWRALKDVYPEMYIDSAGIKNRIAVKANSF